MNDNLSLKERLERIRVTEEKIATMKKEAEEEMTFKEILAIVVILLICTYGIYLLCFS